MPRIDVEEHELGLSWVVAEPMERAYHALVDDGRVWLVDPLDGPEIEDAVALGDPAGVLQLLDRHNRDCAEIAARLGVPHLKVPDAVPGSPFEAIAAVRIPRWQETALWWPAKQALVVAEVLAANPMHTGGEQRVGMHLFLRPWPPSALRGYRPRHLLLDTAAGFTAPKPETRWRSPTPAPAVTCRWCSGDCRVRCGGESATVRGLLEGPDRRFLMT